MLNSEEAAKELLDNRSANYSDRPPFPLQFAWVLSLELLRNMSDSYQRFGWSGLLGLMPYNDLFIRKRRIAQLTFANKNISQYRQIQDEETIVLLHNLLQKPDQFESHLHRYVISY